VVAALIAGQRQIRAGWAERELPRYIDVHKSQDILDMLGVELDTIPRLDIDPVDIAALEMTARDTTTADTAARDASARDTTSQQPTSGGRLS
jgi:hypothetical protein